MAVEADDEAAERERIPTIVGFWAEGGGADAKIHVDAVGNCGVGRGRGLGYGGGGERGGDGEGGGGEEKQVAASEGEFRAMVRFRVRVMGDGEERGESCRGEHGDWGLRLDIVWDVGRTVVESGGEGGDWSPLTQESVGPTF